MKPTPASPCTHAENPDDDENPDDIDTEAIIAARQLLAAAAAGPPTHPTRKPRPLRAHGKRLRAEIINVPGRLAHHARGLTIHLHPSQKDGPLIGVYTALAALPSYAGP